MAALVIFMALNGFMLIPSIPIMLPTVGNKVTLQYTQVTNWFSAGTAVILLPIINAYFGFSALPFTFGTITLIFFSIHAYYWIERKKTVK